MPNWCECDLFITGKKVPEVLTAIKGDDTLFDFNKIIPMPAELMITSPQHTVQEKVQAEKNLRLHGAKDWYDWAHKRWGTKWNASEVSVEKTSSAAKIMFQTAWAPPTPVIIALSAKFPDCRFVLFYFECGMSFQGKLVVEGGKVIQKEEKEYHGMRGG